MMTAETSPITVHVPAKVNVALHVVGQRDDGYHLLDSLVAFTEAGYDRLDVMFGSGCATPELTASGPFAAALPAPADNAVMAAARAVGGIRAIHLTKGLPVASGLGGGSADAAAVLRAAVTAGRLRESDAFALAASLGADVPVCLLGRACRMRGIGETLSPLPCAALPVVLVNPGVEVSTRAAFSRLARKDNAGVPCTDLATASAAIATMEATRNDLMAAAFVGTPVVPAVLRAVTDAPGCAFARMSGSGASVFGIFADDAAARAAAADIAEAHGWWTSATRLAPA